MAENMNDFEKYEEASQKQRTRNKQIRNLALSTLQEMTKLEFTNEEYEYFKNCMDRKIKNSKITL